MWCRDQIEILAEGRAGNALVFDGVNYSDCVDRNRGRDERVFDRSPTRLIFEESSQ
jgi:hypothetical protein